MTEELFRDFWWLIFPVFGMVMAFVGLLQDGANRDRVLDNARRELERQG